MWFRPLGTRPAQGHSRPLVWVARSRRPRGGSAPATTLRSEVSTSSGFSWNQDRCLSQPQGSCLEASTREHTISQREVQNERASHGAHPLPHSQADSAVERFGRGVLWQLQAGLCLSGVSRNGGRLARQLLGWIEHYNHQAPHSALGMQSPAECYAEWLVRNKTRPFQN